MGTDETEYGADAEAFNPERWLTTSSSGDVRLIDGKSLMDPRAYFFGFGRRSVSRLSPCAKTSSSIARILMVKCRACPGLYFAEYAMYMAMVSIFATVSVIKATNSEGKEIAVDGETSGMLVK
jgi:hypothetical protein